MKNALLVACFASISFSPVLRADEQPPVSLPKEVKSTQESLTRWLKGFRDKTQDQVEKDIGVATEKAPWDYQDWKELLLRYTVLGNGRLLLYFVGDRVIEASFQVLSE